MPGFKAEVEQQQRPLLPRYLGSNWASSGESFGKSSSEVKPIMSVCEGKRVIKPNVRYSEFVSIDTAVGAKEPTTRGTRRVVPARPGLDTVNHQVEGNIGDNNEGLDTNTGMASMNTNSNSMENNVNSSTPNGEAVVDGTPIEGGSPQGQIHSPMSVTEPNIMTGNNSIDNNAIEMALHNANEITKINDELMALRTGLELMRGEFDGSALGIQTAVMSIFGALYGKQLDDIKYGYDLEDKNNKVVKMG